MEKKELLEMYVKAQQEYYSTYSKDDLSDVYLFWVEDEPCSGMSKQNMIDRILPAKIKDVKKLPMDLLKTELYQVREEIDMRRS